MSSFIHWQRPTAGLRNSCTNSRCTRRGHSSLERGPAVMYRGEEPAATSSSRGGKLAIDRRSQALESAVARQSQQLAELTATIKSALPPILAPAPPVPVVSVHFEKMLTNTLHPGGKRGCPLKLPDMGPVASRNMAADSRRVTIGLFGWLPLLD
jgi:hypothetical protein